jgi:hypothetical protein
LAEYGAAGAQHVAIRAGTVHQKVWTGQFAEPLLPPPAEREC